MLCRVGDVDYRGIAGSLFEVGDFFASWWLVGNDQMGIGLKVLWKEYLGLMLVYVIKQHTGQIVCILARSKTEI